MTEQDLPFECRRESHAAVLPEKARREEAMLRALRCCTNGATAEELALSIGVHAQVCRPRLTEMHKRGMVSVVGKKKARTGKAVSVYLAPREIGI